MNKKITPKQYFFDWKKILFWISLGLFFLALAIFFTWPLAKNFNSAIIGQSDFTDGPFFLWNIWWVKETLLNFHNPFFTNYVYYPVTANLVLHTLTLTTGLIAIPLTSIFSLVASLNIVLFASMVASALGMVILIKYLTQNKWAGIISGLIFAFNPYLLSHLQAGHFNLTMLWIFPFLVLFFIKTLREKSYLNPLLFSLFLILQSYLDLQLLVFSVCIIIPIFIVEAIFSFRQILSKKNLCNFLIILGLCSLIFILPYIILMKEFWGHTETGLTYNNGDTKIIFGLNPLNPITGKNNLFLVYNLIGSYRENVISLGISVAGLCVLAFFFKKFLKEKISFIVVALVGILLACGSYFQFGGIEHQNIKMPFYFLDNLPGFNLGVVPTRFIVISYFACATLAGLFFASVLELFKGRMKFFSYLILAMATCAVGFEYYGGSLKIDKLTVSPILSEIRNDLGDYTLLPFHSSSRDAFYQTFHQKKAVSGYLGRRIHDYYLIQYRFRPAIDYIVTGDEMWLASDDFDPISARKSFEEYKIKYITVDKTIRSLDQINKMQKFMTHLGYDIWRQDDALIVYKLQ